MKNNLIFNFISNEIQTQLKGKKNLLAFSHGVDSTALFFLLKDLEIPFDIAIVDYGLREQSKDEVLSAKKLAKRYKRTCYTQSIPKIENNFESKAREIRYSFFKDLVCTYNYDTVLTAHHLGDRFEWMLMQFCKGAGCAELSAMQSIEEKEDYTLIRPLLHVDKSELLQYLHTNNIKYFEDETNTNTNYKRNKFRLQHSNPLLKEHLEGIKKSFQYLDEDITSLITKVEFKMLEDFMYFQSSSNRRSDIYAIDKYLKSQLHMLSAHERELLKQNNSVVIGRKFIVVWHNSYVLIAPYSSQNIIMPKEFKEKMRKLKIEPKLREYFFSHLELFESLEGLFALE